MRPIAWAIVLAGLLVAGCAHTRHTKPAIDLSISAVSYTGDLPNEPWAPGVLSTKGEDMTFTGPVIVVINDIRLTATSATWHSRLNRLVLENGAVQIDLPSEPAITVGTYTVKDGQIIKVIP